MRLGKVFVLFCLLFVTSAQAQEALKELKITEILPDLNDIIDVKQLSIQFSQPLISSENIGSTFSTSAIKISPKIECVWRWVDEDTIVCNPNKTLQNATEYTVTIDPLFTSVHGKYKMKTSFSHKFITSRPKVTYSWVEDWLSASKPVVVLMFNQPVISDSLKKSVYFLNGNYSEKIPVDISYTASSNYDQSVLSNSSLETLPINARYSWSITPSKDLKIDTHISLNVDAGILSAVGSSLGVDAYSKKFDTYGSFKFLGIQCQDKSGKDVRVNNDIKCDPEGRVSLLFSVPVSKKGIKENIEMFSESIDGKDKKVESGDNLFRLYTDNFLAYDHEKSDVYEVQLRAPLSANKRYTFLYKSHSSFTDRFLSFIKGNFLSANENSIFYSIVDVFDRVLQNDINFSFVTDALKPSFRMKNYSQSSVLEKNVNNKFFVKVGGIDELKFTYNRFMFGNRYEKNLSVINKVPQSSKQKFLDVSFNAFDLLKNNSGLLYGTLSSKPKDYNNFYDSPVMIEVTPYQVYAKVGALNTVVWVSKLCDGSPVRNAKVSFHKGFLSDTKLFDSFLSSATTDSNGLAVLSSPSSIRSLLSGDYYYEDSKAHRFFLKVESSKDMAVLPMKYQFRINTYGLLHQVSSVEKNSNNLRSWGFSDKGIYAQNSEMKYKVYVRAQSLTGLTTAPKDYNYDVLVLDSSGQIIYTVKDISFSKFGSYVGSLIIPQRSIVGKAHVKLIAKSKNSNNSFEMDSISFIISDFRISSFKVKSSFEKQFVIGKESVGYNTLTELYSGGVYPNASVRISAFLRKGNFSDKKEELSNFVFEKEVTQKTNFPIYEKTVKLDKDGYNLSEFHVDVPDVVYGNIVAESSVMDERGRYVSTSKKIEYFASDILVGIKSSGLSAQVGKKSKLNYVVVNKNGNKVGKVNVDLVVEKEEVLVSKVKNTYGIYDSTYIRNWKNVYSCSGVSSSKKVGTCFFTPKESGSYRVIASITGSNDVKVESQNSLWVSGKDYVLWHNSNNDKFLEVTQEKEVVSVGEKARYFVKNPYPKTKALVSIEQSTGVLESFVVEFNNSSPIIEIPIKKEYMPGYYLSVVVFSPRVSLDKSQKEKALDISQPKVKLGYVKTNVIEKNKPIKILIKTNKEIYKPEEKIHLKLSTISSSDVEKNSALEFSVLVLNESLVDLLKSGREYFNPYRGFYKFGLNSVLNYSLINKINAMSRVSSLKGESPGGDGVDDFAISSVMPNLNDNYVVYWQPSLHANAGRELSLDFKLPKSLSSWVIIVSAVDKNGLMLFKTKSIVTNQAVQIKEALPKSLVSGDNFDARFTVYNKTNAVQKSKLEVIVQSKILKNGKLIFKKNINLNPHSSKSLSFPINLIEGESGDLRLFANVKSAHVSDSVSSVIKVLKKGVMKYTVFHSSTSQSKISTKFFIPTDSVSSKSKIEISASSSGIASLKRDYENIAYHVDDTGIEFALSKAISAALYQSTSAKDYFLWSEAKTLPQDILKRLSSVQARDGGICYFGKEHSEPYLTAYVAFAFDIFRAHGVKIPDDLNSGVNSYLDNLLKSGLNMSVHDYGTKSDIIAFSLFTLAKNNLLSTEDFDRYEQYVPSMSIFGKSYFIRTAVLFHKPYEYYSQIIQSILNQQNKSPTTTSFFEKSSVSLFGSMGSNLKSNCALLSAFISLPEKSHQLGIGPLFKLLRGIMSLKSNDMFNTQEMVFCAKAIDDYTQKYDKNNSLRSVNLQIDNLKAVKMLPSNLDSFSFEESVSQLGISKNHAFTLSRDGSGRMYYSYILSALSSSLRYEAFNGGMGIKRFYSVLKNGRVAILNRGECVKRGDLLRVDLFVSAPIERHYVVVEDHIPGGLSVFNTNIATESSVQTNMLFEEALYKQNADFKYKIKDSSDYGFSHDHVFSNSVKFYAESLGAGNYHMSYNAQAIATGHFFVLPASAKESYVFDIFGQTGDDELCVVD